MIRPVNGSGMKRMALLNDLSCFGKCSLSVAMPILSSYGVETVPLPTAILSTHTADGFGSYVMRDMTDEMKAFARTGDSFKSSSTASAWAFSARWSRCILQKISSATLRGRIPSLWSTPCSATTARCTAALPKSTCRRCAAVRERTAYHAQPHGGGASRGLRDGRTDRNAS